METKKTTSQTDYKAYLTQLEEFLQLYLVKKAPALPENAKEFIVKIAPWLTLIIILISLPAILFVFGLGSFFLPFSFLGGYGAGFNYVLSMVVLAISLVLEAMAIPGLFKRARKAWYLVYYSALINALHNILLFNLGGLIIGTLLSLYILFQVKEYYK